MMRLCSSFRSVMHRSDLRKNKMCRELSSPTSYAAVDKESPYNDIFKIIDVFLKIFVLVIDCT